MHRVAAFPAPRSAAPPRRMASLAGGPDCPVRDPDPARTAWPRCRFRRRRPSLPLPLPPPHRRAAAHNRKECSS